MIVVIMMVLLPSFVFAQAQNSTCSSKGYTIATINGVFTDESGAILNRDALKYYFKDAFNNQPLTVDYLHNPSHLAGIGDLLMSAYQKIFDKETVEDYDLIEMLKSASEKVKTQKLLLVAHSQGNFYANSFYDTVAGKTGGVPAESIGVYGVATPASRVAGGGKWFTSDTDKIIAGVVGRLSFKKIMPPNTHIELQNGDDANGHNFKDVYLKYKSAEIVSNIQASLNRLSINTSQKENVSCISSPELTLAHKLEGAVLAVADPVASAGSDAVAFAGTVGAKATVWTYDTAANAAKTVAQTALATASSLTIAAKSLTGGAQVNLTENNSATVNVVARKPATSPTDAAPANRKAVATPVSVSAANRKTVAKPPILSSVINTAIAAEPSETSATSSDQSSSSKIVFVGPRASRGIASIPPSSAKIEEAEIESIPEEELSAPVLSVPQCGRSLAADDCLLAETSARFEWAPVSGALYYSLNRNGVYATTTETALDITASDFSDYALEVAAVGAVGRKSATSTKTISIATIPIAINEIAWMGTNASAYDEWLELKNNTGHTIDLSQWVLGSRDGAPYIILSGSIAPHEYRVLERRENTIVVNAEVSVYGNGSPQWALGNGGEELVLSRASTTLDKTPTISGGNWTAGDSASSTNRKTMERYNPKASGDNPENWMTWGTNVGFIKIGFDADGNQILGTPGDCNSVSFLNINGGQTIASSTMLEADNCYYISSGVRVSASSTLTIEEGARVSLYQNNLYVDGVLDINGAEDNTVVFDSFSSEATTNRIRISGSSGTSTIDNAVISNTGGVYLNNGADIEITNTDFINNNFGIELNNESYAIIENVNFASTTREAVSAYSGSVVEVASSTISNALDTDAIGIYDSTFSIASTTINNVYDGDGIGAYDSTVSLASSTISNVLSGDGIGLYNSTTTVANVAVENTDGDGIAVYGGSISGNATIDGAEVEY
mgnify:CR=1 FL=1